MSLKTSTTWASDQLTLDTNAAIYLTVGIHHRLSKATLDRINTAQILWIPAMLPLELTYLTEAGRLEPKSGYEKVMTFLTTNLEARLTDIPAHALVRVAQNLSWTRDPFDRLICAEAIWLKAPLITTDHRLHQHLPAGAALR